MMIGTNFNRIVGEGKKGDEELVSVFGVEETKAEGR